MSHFLYLRGRPGVGKITVARLVQRDLGWRLFWFHDLKNSVQDIVGDTRIPRLMDAVTAPVLEYLLQHGHDVIYVRPSPDRETVDAVGRLVGRYSDYTFHPVQLSAGYDTLLSRVLSRNDPYRIHHKNDLDVYLQRVIAEVPGEFIIHTDGLSPATVSRTIQASLASD
jgi:hypothetical protein